MPANERSEPEASSKSRRDALKLAGAVALGGAALMAAAGSPLTPEPAQAAGRFSVEIDGVLVAGVQSFDATSENDVLAVRNGGQSTPQLAPGELKPGEITIEKDWSSTHEFFNWRKAVLDGKVDRKSISVVFSEPGNEAGRINFYRCWPSKWTGPNLNAKNSGHATETIHVVFETMEMK